MTPAIELVDTSIMEGMRQLVGSLRRDLVVAIGFERTPMATAYKARIRREILHWEAELSMLATEGMV